MAKQDVLCILSDKQAISTTPVNSTNVWNSLTDSAVASGVTGRNLAAEDIWLVYGPNADFVDSSGVDAVLTIRLQSDDTDILGSPTANLKQHWMEEIVPLAGLKKGMFRAIQLPFNPAADYRRYVFMRYTTVNGPFTAASLMSAELRKGKPDMQYYAPSAYKG